MKEKKLRLKTAFKAVMLVLMLCGVGIIKGYAYYNFSAVCPSGQTLYYETNGSNVTVTFPGYNGEDDDPWDGYTRPMGTLIIPNEVVRNNVTYHVISIDEDAFYYCDGLTSVEIPNSVTSIGNGAFWHCDNLTSIEIPNSVTSIGNMAFSYCRLESIVISQSVTSIGSGAFYDCTGLTSVYYTGNIAQWCNITFDEPFSIVGASSNPLYYAHNLYINNVLVTDLIIPNTVTEIKKYAFYNCSGLTSVTIGNSVESIGCGAFYGCDGLTSVYYTGNIAQWCNITFGYDSDYGTSSNPLYYAHNLYINNTLVTDLIIPENVTEVKPYAFNCSGLTSVKIGHSVESIGCGAFYKCSGLTYIDVLVTTPPTISNNTFSNVSKSIPVYIPEGTLDAYQSAQYWNQFTNLIETNYSIITASVNPVNSGIVSGVGEYKEGQTCILTATPNNCYSFVNWTKNGDVMSTEPEYSFTVTENASFVANFILAEIIEDDYTYLVDLVKGEASVKANNTSVTSSLFATSVEYQNVEYPVTSIAQSGFSDCTNITEMIIPNSIITIQRGAFARCSFSKVVIPSSVTSIGQQAFFHCNSLHEVVFEDGSELITLYNNKYSDGIGGGLFEDCPVDKAYIGRNIAVSNYNDSYNRPWTNAPFSRWWDSTYAPLAEVTIGSGVTRLCNYFFHKCNAVSSITSCIQHPVSMTMGTNVFVHVPTSTCVLYVPAGSLEEYQSTSQWSDFSNIQTMAYVTISGYGSSTESDKWAFIASPLADDMDPEDIDGLIATTPADFDLYQLNPAATNEWENWKQTGDHYHFNLVNGRGYLYANRNDVNIILQGDMFTGDYKDVTLQTGWNLVGNPYAQSAYINRSYYKMNAAGDDIEAVSAYTTTAIPVCTGVVVQGASNSDVVRFTTSKPSKSTGNGGLQMTLAKAGNRGNEMQDKAIVIFEENVQLGKYIFNENHAKLYIPQNGNDYAIAYSDGQSEIQLYFRTKEMGTYTINFNNDAELINVYLVDKFEGAVIDLSVCSSYTFIGSSADRPDRFELVFGSPTESETDNFAYQSGNEIIVNGDGELQVFDVMGRMVAKLYVNGIEMIAKPSVNGVYIFRLNEKTQKIVVK